MVEIVLVYRGELTENWSKRCLYLDDKFHPTLGYNHRSILKNEIIFEYDEDDMELNKRLADRVIDKLKQDKIPYSKWHSGNKSTHVHILIRDYDVRNPSLFKNAIMRHYGTFYMDENKHIWNEDKEGRTKILPDLRLSAQNHLIRAEYGIHEKTQDYKSPIFICPDYPCKSKVPIHVFEKYQHAQERSVVQRMSQKTSDLSEHDVVKKLLDTVQFKEGMDDGRERVMFCLIHILKNKFDNKEDLGAFLYEWYRYTSGFKMSEEDVRRKVRYHWEKSYTITESYLRRIIDEVGGKI